MNLEQFTTYFDDLLSKVDAMKAEMKTWNAFGQSHQFDKNDHIHEICEAYTEKKWKNIYFNFNHFNMLRKQLKAAADKIKEILTKITFVEFEMNSIWEHGKISVLNSIIKPKFELTNLTRWTNLEFQIGLDYEDNNQYILVSYHNTELNFSTEDSIIRLDCPTNLERYGERFKRVAELIEQYKTAEVALEEEISKYNGFL